MPDPPVDPDAPTASWHGGGANAPAAPAVPKIEGYEILGRLGEGGMGIVWKAVQLSTRREVALKFLAAGAFATDKARHRFEREVELAAALEHPNIARVYDSGLTHGGYYYAMQLVPGAPLDEYVEKTRPTQREILSLMRTICRAVQHAHQRGVIHRDLKPSNILVTAEGTPYVLDFGLAKSLVSEDADRSMSTEGGVAGTPGYMSPEQALGRHKTIDVRTDVYSLGAILYRLLTGRTPHGRVGSQYEVLQRIAQEEVKPPHEINRLVRRDVEALVLKALAKDPEKRYGTAGEFAADIENYLKGDPITARSHTAAYFLMNRVRRHWGKVSIAAGLTVVFVGLAVYSYVRITHELGRAVKAEKVATTSAEQAAADRKVALDKVEEARRALYINRITLADVQRRVGNPGAVIPLLDGCPKELRNWEWYFLRRNHDLSIMTLRGHESMVLACAYSPDGRLIASGGSDGTVRIWDAGTGKQLKVIPNAGGYIYSLAFDPEGKRLVSGGMSKTVKVWDVETGNQLLSMDGHEGWILGVAWSRDGTRLASGSDDGTVRMWNAKTGEALKVLRGHTRAVNSVAFVGLGKKVASGSSDQTVRVWDSETGEELKRLTVRSQVGEVSSCAVGDWVAIAKGEVRRWDSATGTMDEPYVGHGDACCVSLDGESGIASGGWDDGTVRLWHPGSNQEDAILRGHSDRVNSVSYSPDALRVVSASSDGTLKIWDTKRTTSYRLLIRGAHNSVAFSGDGNRLVTSTWGFAGMIFDLASGALVRSMPLKDETTPTVAVNKDGSRIVTASHDGAARIWDARTGGLLATLKKNDEPLECASFSPDGKLIATGGRDKTVRLWDAETYAEIKTLGTHSYCVGGVAFSPDGELLLSADVDGERRLWSVGARTQIRCWGKVRRYAFLSDVNCWIVPAGFSADGKTMVTADCDGNVQLWDTETGNEIRSWRAHQSWIFSASFSPDGRRLVTGSRDGTARLWDVESGAELATLCEQQVCVHCVRFSPDATKIAAGTVRGVLLWDSGPWDDNAPNAGAGAPRKE